MSETGFSTEHHNEAGREGKGRESIFEDSEFPIFQVPSRSRFKLFIIHSQGWKVNYSHLKQFSINSGLDSQLALGSAWIEQPWITASVSESLVAHSLIFSVPNTAGN